MPIPHAHVPSFASALVDAADRRHASEFASALASLQIAKALSAESQPLLDDAIRRIEGHMRIERMLLVPEGRDLGNLLLELCSLLSLTRPDRPRFRVRLVGCPLLIRDQPRLRIVLIVAYEFLEDAARRWDAGGEEISIRVAAARGHLRLTVVDRNGGGQPAVPGAPRGLEVLRRLARPFGGRIACRRDGELHLARAIFPAAMTRPSVSAGR